MCFGKCQPKSEGLTCLSCHPLRWTLGQEKGVAQSDPGAYGGGLTCHAPVASHLGKEEGAAWTLESEQGSESAGIVGAACRE